MSDVQPPRGSWLSLLLVAIGALVGLAVLIVLTLGQMIFVLVIVAGIFGLAAFHYVVWGWWLSRMIRDEEQADELEPPRSARQPDSNGDPR